MKKAPEPYQCNFFISINEYVLLPSHTPEKICVLLCIKIPLFMYIHLPM